MNKNRFVKTACYIGTSLLIIVPLLFFSKYMLVEYVPVLLIPHAESYFEEFPELAHESEFLDSVIFMLDKYDERYDRKNGTIYIELRLARDEDTLANYTRKALVHCGREFPDSKTAPAQPRVLDLSKLPEKEKQ